MFAVALKWALAWQTILTSDGESVLVVAKSSFVVLSPRLGCLFARAHLLLLSVTREGHLVLEVSQIDWIEAQDYYSALHVGPTTHLVRESMSRLAARLDPKKFVRIHRSTILHLDRLQSIETPSAGDVQVVLSDGTRRRVSRSGFRRLKQVLPMLR